MKFPDYQPLETRFDDGPLAEWLSPRLPELNRRLDPDRHGDMPRWKQALEDLPHPERSTVDLLNSVSAVHVNASVQTDFQERLESALKKLHPWRKGPFSLFGVEIDTEWRSDWKWDRFKDAIDPLRDRVVLDVGCGSGYHCWRMAGAGAKLVLGIEPMLLYVMQYWAIRRLLGDFGAWVLPLAMEDLPGELRTFDTVFSMGVMYHRKSPFDHLLELKGALRGGGQLVLETLVVEGDENTVLVPKGRYARMRNVWCLPSIKALSLWLAKTGFRDIQMVDVTMTSTSEQRSTEWMTFESLKQCLDPADECRTVEGYPAPLRAILTARV